jgi:hypothetical protein
MNNYLAIDPGKMTGVARYEVLNGETYFESFELESRYQVGKYVDDRAGTLDVVIVERFDISERTAKLSAQYDALYIIGALDYICHERDIPFLLSGRDAKGFSSDNKLRTVGWYRPTPGGHANDASRHLLRYLAVAARDPFVLSALEVLA